MNATTDQNRIAHMLARMTAPPAPRQTSPEQVALLTAAARGSGKLKPEMALLALGKAANQGCTASKAALNTLAAEHGVATATAPTPAPKPAAAPVVKRPAATGPAEPVVCSREAYGQMSRTDRELFRQSGGIVTEPVREQNAFAAVKARRETR